MSLSLLFKRDVLDLSRLSLSGVIHSARVVASIGIPAALTNALTPFSAGLITALIALHGSETIAGYGYAVRFEGIFLLVPMVMGGALSPFIGQNWGAHLSHRVIEALGYARRISLYWGLGCCLVLQVLAPSLTSFLSDDAQVQSTLSLYLRVLSVSFAFQGLIYSANATFNAINNPFRATLVSTMNSLILALPLAYVGHLSHGYQGIIVGLLGARLVTGLLANYWVGNLFDDNDEQVAFSDQDAKKLLYRLESDYPEIGVDLERMTRRLGQLPDLKIVKGASGHLTYVQRGREVAHLYQDGLFDVCLPPQLRDAAVYEEWATHHRREFDGCWVSHDLKRSQDIEVLIRLLMLSQAYLTCLEEPAPLEQAQSEAGRFCEVTRTLEAKTELSEHRFPALIFSGLVESISAARLSRHSSPATELAAA